MRNKKYVGEAERDADRKKMWDAVRKFKSFTKKEIAFESDTDFASCQKYVNALHKGSFIERTPNKRDRSTIFILKKDIGIDSPRINLDGTELAVSTDQRMWQAMKILKTFTYNDVCMSIPNLSKSTAKQYIDFLVFAGYIKQRPKDEFYLIPSMVTGNLAPSVRRVPQVYDPNLGKVVWPLEGAS